MQRFNWPRPPLILGLVLGPLAENKLFLSIGNYGLEWFFRPGVLLLIALTLTGIFYPMLRARWQKGKSVKGAVSVPEAVGRNGTGSPRFSWAMFFSLFIIVVFICALWQSRRFDFRTGLFPWTAGFSVLALSIIQLAMDLMRKEDRREMGSFTEVGHGLPIDVVDRRKASIISWLISFFMAIWLFGFSIGGTLCTFLYLKVGAREKWLLSLILTMANWAFIYVLFDRALHVPFPTGQLFLLLKSPSM